MREIKFRAWDKTKQRFTIDHDMLAVTFNGNVIHASDIGTVSRDDLEPMQYTGLKDRHGVEIYEGDIVLYCIAEKAYKVGFSNGCFCLLGEDGLPVDLDWGWEYLPTSEGMKVIGNIWENPELLKTVERIESDDR